MAELHLRQPGFTYSACDPFAKGLKNKKKQRIKKFKETGDSNYIYKNELDNACFDHHAVYINGKYLAKRTVSDKVLKDRASEIAINPKYDGYQRGLAIMDVGSKYRT